MTGEVSLPSRPEQYGAALRQLREGAGVSLDEICAETKISRRILESLEAGRFQFLPERVFTRNFVRQYARLIGADERLLLDGLDAAWERFAVSSGSHPSLVVDEPVPQHAVRWQFWVPLVLGAIVALAATAVIVQRSRQSAPAAADPMRTMAGLPTPVTNPTDAPSPAAAVPTVPSAEGLPTRGGEVTTGTLDLGVRVTSGKECWIRYRDREGHTEQELLRAGEELKLALEAPVLLTLGNAAAATVRVGGVEYKDLGRPGEVLHVEVTPSGVTPLRSGAGDE